MPHLRALLGALAAAAIPLALVAAAAPASAADTWTVPSKAWITIKGHGYGHGHGMSQYGAEGAAREGLGFRGIAEFYYPGTTWGEARGRIRVLISSDTSDDLVVRSRPGLVLRDGGTGQNTVLPDKDATRWRIDRNAAGQDRVSYLTDHWHRYRLLEGEGAFDAGGAPVTLVTPSGDRPYRGRLWSSAPSAGSSARNTVNVLTLESYLKGVVPLEMPASWSQSALRAQAVAARTYAAYERDHLAGPMCDTTSCQVYGGYAAEQTSSNAAVDATSRQVLEYAGAPAFTQFASSSGGWTSAGSVPYLPAQADPYDDWAGNPVHAWSLRVQDGAIERAWPGIGNLQRIAVVDRDGHGQWGGRVGSIRIVGSKGRVNVSGDTLRGALGLRSPWVTFVVKPRAS
jgi:stage II sporulation protein D